LGGDGRSHVVTLRALLAPDCGPGVGLGHLERMLALADALQPHASVSLIIPEGEIALRRRVADRGHAVIEAPGETADRVESVIAAVESVDRVVLDGYVFDAAFQRRIRDRAPLTVVDDLGLAADCDLAVNPSPGGERLRPTGADAFLGGAAYALIRASFADARATVLRDGRARRTVLVSTGATDIGGISGHVTAELLARDATVEVVRVVGPDGDGIPGNHEPRLRLLVSPASLAEALARSTLYVGAAGTTAVQAACVGVPSVINDAVANQSAQAAALAGAGCAVVAGAGELATECLHLLDDPSLCDAMAEQGRALIDGRGAQRVADAIRRLAQVDAP
jgi:spore coat polysaccharide biosynthesis predicted glycosyltransferase SpsG